MSMNLDAYQTQARGTDQNPTDIIHVQERLHASEVIPLLGLVGEVGSLLAEYKKLLRDGASHRNFSDEVSEELGDILWYVANVATKHGLSLEAIAQRNLEKTKDRWAGQPRRSLPDEADPPEQRLPRHFRYEFRVTNDANPRVTMRDLSEDCFLGDPLTDNAYEDNGYRWHDVMHLALGSRLGWSPVWRKLLRKSDLVARRTRTRVDEVEDGGRAQVIDEAVVACAYAYASRNAFLTSSDSVDWTLLKQIQRLTVGLEVETVTAKEWNDALILGFRVWDQIQRQGGGIVIGDLEAGTLEALPLTT
jgi:NTP pyrophosphatase (non-canonical NTP hydrolase)